MTPVADAPQFPEGYKNIPEEDQRKAKAFFDRGRTVADSGQYEYAIEMYIQGLAIDPENMDGHQALREISLKRKASGGKDMGMFEKGKFSKSTKDDKLNMLNAEKLLAYDPGNTDRMVTMLQSAQRGGYYDTVLWIGAILMKANAEGKKPDFSKFIVLKDVYKSIERWDLATQAGHYAAQVRPSDMDLTAEVKNLSAMDAMTKGKYNTAKTFRDSIRDMDAQKRLLEMDKDVRTTDSLLRGVQEAEAEWQADPNEPGKLNKLIEALIRTERDDMEERAIQLLEDAYVRTKQFRWRQKQGQIRFAQLSRRERLLRERMNKEPANEEAKAEYQAFIQQKLQEELNELTQWVDNYPTDSNYRFQMALRLFALGRYDEAIPVFQHVRNDPKYRVKAATYLGRAFFESQFPDEAADTFRSAMEEYQVRGDDVSKDMFYWFGRSLEQMNTIPEAIKAYSQVAQWDFNYRDVQQRIRRLRSGGPGGGTPGGPQAPPA